MKDLLTNNPEDRDIIKAISESLQNFTGSLTGKNLEDKLTEFSEVYGEILLYLYREIHQQKREIQLLKKKLLFHEKETHQNLPTINSQPKIKIQILTFFIFLLSILNVILIMYILWR